MNKKQEKIEKLMAMLRVAPDGSNTQNNVKKKLRNVIKEK